MSLALDMPKRPTRALRFPRRLSGEYLLLLALVVFVGVLSVVPLARLAWSALMPHGVFDAERIADILGGRRVLEATLNTVKISVASTMLATIAGTAAALLVSLTDMRYRTAWVFGFVLPLMIPPQVTALAWIQAFSPASPVLGPLGLTLPPGTPHPLYSMGGIVFLLGLYNAPLVFLSVRASLQRLPASLIEAARSNGAGAGAVTRDIVLPLIRSGIFAGAALAFVSSIGNFGIQAMLGIPARVSTLITMIYRRLNSYGPSALSDMALLALLLAALTVMGMGLTAWLGRQGDQRVDAAQRPPRMALGRWRMAVSGAAWLYLVICLLLPLSALFGTALVRGYGQPLNAETITFENFANALFHHEGIRAAFLTSLWITLVTVAVLIPVAVALGYVLSWRKGRVAKLLRLASELAYALPGIIIGVAMILFFLRPLPGIGTSLYGTVWVILAAYLSNYLALALRPILGGYAQIDRGLDEAAQLAGAGIFSRLKDIVLPALAPSATAAAILVFMTAINEIQTSVLLVSSRAQTIGPTIIFLEEAGSSTLAAAVGCLMVVLVLVLMGLSLVFGRRLPEGVLPWRD
ncbi:iron(III) transport system permease protein [Breoghania corrubedonensis]|uniref:Iron(III) transport system permease protein n=1 Tax=Breoghania corrubedonensis TaxID=665038 RepID=A0A2T5VI80_9HYPH|nr:iron ABC transporter permease [Breoghania corrubedonensis]PTW63426.1 iron(III) transport system permease protein [Breoghania corrubedonensis]